MDFRVVTAGGEGHYDDQQIHKVTLVLGTVTDEDGDLVDLELDDARMLPREEEET